jgi:hypothetical protein
MPQISRFFGIVIYMYFNDHARLSRRPLWNI